MVRETSPHPDAGERSPSAPWKFYEDALGLEGGPPATPRRGARSWPFHPDAEQRRGNRDFCASFPDSPGRAGPARPAMHLAFAVDFDMAAFAVAPGEEGLEAERRPDARRAAASIIAFIDAPGRLRGGAHPELRMKPPATRAERKSSCSNQRRRQPLVLLALAELDAARLGPSPAWRSRSPAIDRAGGTRGHFCRRWRRCRRDRAFRFSRLLSWPGRCSASVWAWGRALAHPPWRP